MLLGASENITSAIIAKSGPEQLALQIQLVLLSVVGTVGNALVLFVFGRTKEELVSVVFIMSLAWVDFLACFVVIPFTMYMEYVDFYVASDAACKFYEFLVTSPMQFSALIMVCIAVDRYVCICRPLAKLFTKASARAVALSTGLLAAVLGLFPALGYGVYTISRSVPTDLVYQLYDSSGADELSNVSLHQQQQQQQQQVAVADGSSQESSRNVTAVEFDRLPDENLEDRDVRILEFCRRLSSMMMADSEQSSSSSSSSFECPVHTVVYTGHCQPTAVLLGASFHDTYRVFYHAIFVTCLLTAFVLYAFTYRSVLRHRAGQQKRRSRCLETVVYGNNHHQQQQQQQQQQLQNNPNSTDTTKEGGGPTESRRQSMAWCRERIDSFFSDAARLSYARYRANAKTAAMLFVVTLTFAVCYVPALLVLWKFIVTYEINVFYLYFANNACNPIIYSFMNRNFRDNLKTTLRKLKRNHRSRRGQN